MNITKAEVQNYLLEVYDAIHSGNYQISARAKNQVLFTDFVFTEKNAAEVICSLTADNFSDAVYNDHPSHSDEILYIFGKDVRLLSRFYDAEETISLYIKFNKLANQYLFVISFHPQEHPLTYKFIQEGKRK